MPKGKQKNKRAHRRVEVRFGLDEPQFIGFSGNVSRTGVMVRGRWLPEREIQERLKKIAAATAK